MSSEDEQLDNLLIEALKGNRQALDDLCGRLTPRLAQALKGKIPRDLQAIVKVDDVVQETFVDVIHGLERGQFTSGGAAAFLRWMQTIASNNLKDLGRAHRHDRENMHPSQRSPDRSDDSVWALFLQTAPGTKDTPSKTVGRKEAIAMMRGAMKRLKGSHQQIIVEYDLKQRPMREVAAELGISEGAAFMRRNRAIRELRDLLGSTWRFFGDSA